MTRQCRYCQYKEDESCTCNRCRSVRASGYCNRSHADYFAEEMAIAWERAKAKAS